MDNYYRFITFNFSGRNYNALFKQREKKMTTLEISSILTKKDAHDVLQTVTLEQKLIKEILSEKDDKWNSAQFAEFFRLMAADNLLNFYMTHTHEGYEHALRRWKNAEEAAQKAYREENFI